jgi:hypothetical protein
LATSRNQPAESGVLPPAATWNSLGSPGKGCCGVNIADAVYGTLILSITWSVTLPPGRTSLTWNAEPAARLAASLLDARRINTPPGCHPAPRHPVRKGDPAEEILTNSSVRRATLPGPVTVTSPHGALGDLYMSALCCPSRS